AGLLRPPRLVGRFHAPRDLLELGLPVGRGAGAAGRPQPVLRGQRNQLQRELLLAGWRAVPGGRRALRVRRRSAAGALAHSFRRRPGGTVLRRQRSARRAGQRAAGGQQFQAGLRPFQWLAASARPALHSPRQPVGIRRRPLCQVVSSIPPVVSWRIISALMVPSITRNMSQFEQHTFAMQLTQLSRAWRAELDRRLVDIGLSQARWLVLLHLSRFEAAPTQSQLAQSVGVEGPTLARLLDSLEGQGLVRRLEAPEDRRAKRVMLCETALPLIQRIQRIADELREQLLAGIDPADLQLCQQVHRRILANLQALG